MSSQAKGERERGWERGSGSGRASSAETERERGRERESNRAWVQPKLNRKQKKEKKNVLKLQRSALSAALVSIAAQQLRSGFIFFFCDGAAAASSSASETSHTWISCSRELASHRRAFISLATIAASSAAPSTPTSCCFALFVFFCCENGAQKGRRSADGAASDRVREVDQGAAATAPQYL